MGPIRYIRAEAKEAGAAGRELWHFTRTHNWKRSFRNLFQRKYIGWWIISIILVVFAILVGVYRDPIVNWFEPKKEDIVHFKYSYLIPVAVLILISIPPLGGHEIVLLICGLIWGLYVGFAIACAGTFLGELVCFFGFKYFFTEKARKVERKSIFYACLARLMRDGGLWIVVVVRFSAIPGHVVTALQSTVGMALWKYTIAVIVSLPKQLAIVYLGVMFGETAQNSNPSALKHKQRVSLAVFFATAFATVLALYVVYMRARQLYPVVLAEQEQRKALEGAEAGRPAAVPLHDPTLVGAAWDGESVNGSLDQDNSGKDRVFSAGGHTYVLPADAATINLENPGGPPSYGTSPYAPQQQSNWSEVEARERWEARNEARYEQPVPRRVPPPTMAQYPPQQESTTSFTHLPLQGSGYDDPYTHPR